MAEFTASVVVNRGNTGDEVKDEFFKAGYKEANLIDVVIVIGDKIIANYLHNLKGFPVDFPAAPELVQA